MFDWEDLRYFATFAREKSLSAAARHLKVDHATVARRIAALESALNLKLVDRRPRSYDLTANGERIAALGSKMEDEALPWDAPPCRADGPYRRSVGQCTAHHGKDVDCPPSRQVAAAISRHPSQAHR